MLYDQWYKVKDFVKWLIPFLVALFLLFGCGPDQSQGNQADGTAHQEAVVTGQAEETESTSSALPG